jgi:WD40 repeat protein
MKSFTENIPLPRRRRCDDLPTAGREIELVIQGTLDKHAPIHTVVHRIAPNMDKTNVLTVTPDGRCAMTSSDRHTCLWDLETGICLWSHPYGALSGAAPPGSRRVVTGGMRKVRVFDLFTGRLLRTFEIGARWVRKIIVMSGGRQMLLAEGGKVSMREIDTGRAIRIFSGHEDQVSDISVAPDKKNMVTASRDGTVRCWNLSSWECRWTYRGHNRPVKAVALVPERRQALSWGADGILHLLDLDTGECIRHVVKNISSPKSLFITSDRKWLVTLSSYPSELGGDLMIWYLETNQCVKKISFVHSAALMPKGELLFMTSWPPPRQLTVFDICRQKCIRVNGAQAHIRRVARVRISDSGNRMIVTSESDVKIVSLKTGRIIRTMAVLARLPPILYGQNRLVTANETAVRLWNIEKKKNRIIYQVRRPFDRINAVSVTKTSRLVIATTFDLIIYDSPPAAKPKTIRLKHPLNKNGLDTTPDGRTGVAACGRRIVIVDLDKGAPIRLFDIDRDARRLFLAPDGKSFLILTHEGPLNQPIERIDATTGRSMKVYNTGKVTSMGVSGDGRYIITGKDAIGTSVKLWDLETGSPLLVLPDTKDDQEVQLRFPVSVDISVKKNILIAGGWNGKIYFFNVDDGRLVATFHNVAHGFLWTTSENNPTGHRWLWTDREDMLHVIERDAENNNIRFLAPEDNKRLDYLHLHNNREMVMSGIAGQPASRRMIATRHTATVSGHLPLLPGGR